MMADDFVESLDPGLLTYKNELYMRSVTSFATLKYLRPSEVQTMKIPDVYKRLLIDKIISLQTPETKKSMKLKAAEQSPSTPSTASRGSREIDKQKNRKKLRYDDSTVATSVSVSASKSADEQPKSDQQSNSANAGFLEHEITRLSEERDTLSIVLTHRKDELNMKKVPPVPPRPLAIPGNPVSKLLCDNCHHKGHRAHGNKGNKSCPFVPCAGFQFCGLIAKHKEFKQEITEIEKDVANMEKELKDIDNQITNIRSFMHHNATNFVAAVKPRLKAGFPSKYMGKNGAQNLQRDIRLMKIATGGKIPEDLDSLSRDKLENLIKRGKSKIEMTTGDLEDTDICNAPNLDTGSSAATAHATTHWQSTRGVVPSPSPFPWASQTMPIPYPQTWSYQPYYGQDQYMQGSRNTWPGNISDHDRGLHIYGSPLASCTITGPTQGEPISPPLPADDQFAQPPLPPPHSIE